MKRTVSDVLANEERQRQFDSIAARAVSATRAHRDDIRLRQLLQHSRLDIVADAEDEAVDTMERTAQYGVDALVRISRDE